MAGNANSGRRVGPPKLDPSLTPLRFLKQQVQNENAPARERTSAALGLLIHARIKERGRKVSKSQQEFEDAMEAGWWSDWHVGFSDGVGPDDPSYGTCLLDHTGDWRDPRAKPFRRKWPPEAEYRAAQARQFEQRTGEKLDDERLFDSHTGEFLGNKPPRR